MPAAKLQPRLAATRLVPRSALEHALATALDERRWALLAAAPGYGKTALLASWLRRYGTAAYYRLDAADSNPAALLRGVALALEMAYGLERSPAFAAPGGSHQVDLTAALASLLQSVEARGGRVVLLLDDYQQLALYTGHPAADLLDTLLRLAPPNMRVVFSGWGSLQLAELAAARLCGGLLQLGPAELAYSSDELASLLAWRGLDLSAPVLSALHSFTGGWPGGVEAVLEALEDAGLARHTRLPALPAPLLEHAAAMLSSWLSSVLFPRLDASQFQFLLSAAPLPFLQDTLCDYALQRADSALRLHDLQNSGLLAWQLWQASAAGDVMLRYGLHPLFRRAILLQQADPAPVALVTQRAAAWFVRHREWAPAAAMYLDSGQIEEGASVLDQAARALLPAPLTAELTALARRLPAALSASLLAPPLEVRSLGGFQVLRNGLPISDAEWRRTKVKSLLKLLIANFGRRLSRDMILEALWEHLPPDAALNNFNATLSALRHVLEPGLTQGRASQYVLYQDGYCWANTAANWWVDLATFERLVQESSARRGAENGRGASRRRSYLLDPRAVTLLEEAVALYRGDFLPEDLYEDWPISRRERTRELYLEALIALACHEREHGDLEAAIEHAQKVVEREPFRESVHILLMELYALLGRRGEALRQYQLCARALREEFGTGPSEQTLALYNRISSSPRSAPAGRAPMLGHET